MIETLEYIPGIGGSPIQLNGASAVAGAALGMRSREWDRTLGYRALVSATRPAREVTANLVSDYEAANRIRQVADADVAAMVPGTFVFRNEWRQHGYILASQPKKMGNGWVSVELAIALLDGAWWRLVEQQFIMEDGDGEGSYLDYPFDYEHDYQKTSYTGGITPSVLTPSDVHIVVYGPAINPYVIVGGNRYQVNVTVPAGGYLTIDGRDKTIQLTLADGTVQNAFSYGVRGGGVGGGSYIFERISAGTSEVTFDGSFGFDLGWYEEEGEPPWNQF